MFAGYAYAALYVFGLVWCGVVVMRLPQDLKELTEPRGAVWKFAIIFVWFLTILIAIPVIAVTLALVGNIFDLFRFFSHG